MMTERCSREIVELHRFFEEWFNGRLPDDDASFSRLTAALADDFLMITPEARPVRRAELVKQLRSMNGYYQQDDKPSAIWIKDIEGEPLSDSLCLMRYREWQGNSDRSDGKGRLSSAIFKRWDEAPNGVQWLYLHETWIK